MKKLFGVLFLVQISLVAQARGRAPRRPALAPSYTEQADTFQYRLLEDDQGGFYAVWTHLAPNKTYQLFGQHLTSDGQPTWTAGGLLLEQNLLQTDQWDAAADGKNGFLLAWIEDARARGERFGLEGVKVWPERSGVSVSTLTATSPLVIPDSAGGGFFVWSERRYADRWVLMSQHIGDKGFAIWPVEGARVSLRPSAQQQPKAIYDGSAGVIIVWKDFLDNASQLQIQRMDYQGNRLWGDQGELVIAPAGNSKQPSLLAPLGGGRAAVAWLAQSSNANRLILQSVDPQGKFLWGAEGKPLSYGTSDEWNPKMIGDGLGTLAIGWEDYRDQIHWQAFMALIDQNAQSLWPNGEQALSPVLADQGNLAFVEDGNKGIFAIWVDNRRGKPGIYSQQIDASGRMLSGENGKALAKGLVNPRSLQIINLAPNLAAMGFVDAPRKGLWTLYWKVLTALPVSSAAAPAPTSSNISDGTSNPGQGQGFVP